MDDEEVISALMKHLSCSASPEECLRTLHLLDQLAQADRSVVWKGHQLVMEALALKLRTQSRSWKSVLLEMAHKQGGAGNEVLATLVDGFSSHRGNMACSKVTVLNKFTLTSQSQS